METNPLMADARQRIALMMMQNGSDTSPIQSWTQGAARVANAITGGMMLKQQRDDNKEALASIVNSLIGEQPAASPVTQPGQTPDAAVSSAPPSPPGGMYGNNKVTTATGESIPLPPANPLGRLDPEFRNKFADMRAEAAGRGVYFNAPDAGSIGNTRTPDQQTALYAQGRTTPGPIVTNTTNSNHLTGRALDVVPVGDTTPQQIGSTLTDLSKDPRFAGTRSGATFSNLNDPLHIELNKPQGTQLASADPNFVPAPIPNAPVTPPQAQPIPNATGDQPTMLAQNSVNPKPILAPANQPTIPPNVRAGIMTALSSDSPMAQSLGMQLLSKYITPHNPVAVPAGGSLYDPIAGKVVFNGGEKPTNDILNYHQAVAQGFKGTLTDFMTQMKNAGAQRVTLDQRAPTSFEQTYGEAQAKSAAGVVDAGEKASATYQSNQMLRALNNAITTGKITPAQATIGAWAQSVGINPASLGIDPKLPTNAETYAALSNESMMRKLGPGGFPSQNFSDTDRKFLEKTVTNLGDRPEANELKLAISDRISQLQMEKADKWQSISTSVPAADRANAYEKFERDWRKEMKTRNVFGDLAAQVGGGAPAPQGGGIPQGWSVQVH